jgi:hypothetical protein
MGMKSKPCWNIAIVGLGAVTLGLLGVWLFPHRPANGQEWAAGTAIVGTMPEGTGIAAKYPGDVGIERDPAVLFADRQALG